MNRFFHTKAALWLALPIGAALSLAFAPFDWWWLAILCPAFLFLAWRGAAPRDAAKLGFLFTSGMYLAGTYWLYNSIHGIGEAPIWLTLFVMLAMVAILSAYTAFVGYALARWFPESVLSPAAKTGAAAGTVSSNAPLAIRYLLILPAAWVLLEWFRGWFLSGFPWLALGYSHLDTAARRTRACRRRVHVEPGGRHVRGRRGVARDRFGAYAHGRRRRHPRALDPRVRIDEAGLDASERLADDGDDRAGRRPAG